MHFRYLSGIRKLPIIGSRMLKRVHSHMKVRKPNFLEVGLTSAHRSKSLTQIDCLENNSPVMVPGDVREAKSDPDASTGGGHSPTFGLLGLTAGQDRLLVPPFYSEEKPVAKKGPPQKMPSHEYFSVSLDILEEQGYELVPALRNVQLRDALQEILERRGLDISQVNIFLEASNTPLPLKFETYRLGGSHLHVRAKEGTESAHLSRANSTASVCTPGATGRPPALRSNSSNSALGKDERRLPSSHRTKSSGMMLSAEDLVSEVSRYGTSQDLSHLRSKPKSLQSKKGIFSSTPSKVEKEKMDSLTDLLNHYSSHGIPELPGLLTFSSPGDQQGDPYRLEDHWKSIVDSPDQLSKRKQNQQDAIWELLSTEVFYLRRLKVITDLFLACLCNLQNACLLNEIDTEKMFSNITEVFSANHQFWIEYLLPMLNESRTTKSPLNPLLMKEGFLKFDLLFMPYVKYCLEHSRSLQYVKERHMNNELFRAYVVWCETQKDCERLRLVDLLVKPMERLTKYSLLLKAIHKKTDDEELKQALVEMNECVENFVCGVDATLRQRHEQERLASIINRIENYDAIDCNNDEIEKVLKEHCTLDLTCPMPGCGNQQTRQLLLEGAGLKLKDPSFGKVDVHCFLFTDMLLICKAVSKKGDRVRIIRQPYIVDRLIIQELKDGSGFLLVYINEYKVATAAFLLYTQDTKMWMDNIRKAQEQYKEAKAAAASERPELGFLKAMEEDEDYDFPSTALLVTRSPRSSSRSSLVHSHSGSIDMNESVPVSAAGTLPPQSLQCGPVQSRAVSFELGDLRVPSITADDLANDATQFRSHSMETRSPISVTVTSPRPERRAFFLRGAGANTSQPVSPNTLSVSGPYHYGETHEHSEKHSHPSPTTIQIPIIPPPPKTLSPTTRLSSQGPPSPRTLQRSMQISAKPPLVKSKPVTGLIVRSAPPSEGTSPVHSFDSDTAGEPQSASSDGMTQVRSAEYEDESCRRLHTKRNCRTERRYHTADSIENMKKEKDTSIHKRLSWNYGQQAAGTGTGQSTSSGSTSGHERLLFNKHFNKCLSSESVYSSSGVSSTGSLQGSSMGSADYDPGFEGLDNIEEPPLEADPLPLGSEVIINGDQGESTDDAPQFPLSPPVATSDESGASSLQQEASASGFDPETSERTAVLPGSNIKIDVSEVKDGISSVQITVNGGTQGKPSKADLRRMKEFLLTSFSVEASEV